MQLSNPPINVLIKQTVSYLQTYFKKFDQYFAVYS
jgi:hypothetical protein